MLSLCRPISDQITLRRNKLSLLTTAHQPLVANDVTAQRQATEELHRTAYLEWNGDKNSTFWYGLGTCRRMEWRLKPLIIILFSQDTDVHELRCTQLLSALGPI